MSYRIGVIPGDGIGPEVVAEGVKVLAEAAALCDFQYALTEYPWSGRHYLETDELMPDSGLDELRRLDAIFLGALGDPRVERGLVERAVVLAIRLGLDLYINLRPIVLYADRLSPLKHARTSELDMVVVRENTEDVYVGVGGSIRPGTPQEVALAQMVFTRHGVERAVRYAFDLARMRAGKRRVTLVDKANAIRAQELWRRVLAEVGAEYPDIKSDAMYVDAAVMHMVTNPGQFDVIVTTNLFGDIITDLGAALQGGLGSAASGNIHPGDTSMFEPIHGSAPDIAGKGVASPVGAILAVAMMLDYLGEKRAATQIERAVRATLVSGRLPTLDAQSGLTTSQTGDIIVDQLRATAAGS